LPKNYQDQTLNELRKKEKKVKVYLINGMQLQGKIDAFDNFVIILIVKGEKNMIYKHAISTIISQN
jgi:host factor-I protein